jgi:hypothetical protein
MSTGHIWWTYPPYSNDIQCTCTWINVLVYIYIYIQVCLNLYFMEGVFINKWESILYMMYIMYPSQLKIINKENNYVGNEFSALQMTCSPWTS